MIPCIFAISNWFAKKNCKPAKRNNDTELVNNHEVLKVLPDDTKTIGSTQNTDVYTGETNISQNVPFISEENTT